MNAKELLELFIDGIDCLSSSRHIAYEAEKEIQKLHNEGRIIIEII